MNAIRKLRLAFAIYSLFVALPAVAQNAADRDIQQEITVATRVVPPFVEPDGEAFSGFSVELWRAITVELGIKAKFVPYGTVKELLDSVRSGRHEAGISAISVTAERSQTLEFSQPMFRSGLSILVPNNQQLNVLNVLFSWEMAHALGFFLLLLTLPAHVIWLLVRGRDDGLPISDSYYPGIIDAIFWCAESMGGAAQAHPTRVFARVAAIIWIYIGIVMIAYFTAFATTSLTMQSLRSDINGPKDLAGKNIGAVSGSTSERYAASLNAKITSFSKYELAAEAMIAGKVQAVIYDTPMLLNLARKDSRVQIAGAQFKPESYGIVFALNSPLRHKVNEALLRLMENGTYDMIYKKYFGSE
jgi:polar amino acid transport system substrate-binding protein